MTTFKGITSLVVVGLMLVLCVGTASGQEKSKDKAKPSGTRGEHYQAHLGIGVEALPLALSRQLGELLGKDQGVLIGGVEEGSPAAKAGVRKYDILTSFDDQKVYSTEQLITLVHADKPGRTVKLGLIRNGKPQEVKVTLGQQAEQPLGPFASEQRRMMQHMVPLFRGMGPMRLRSGRPNWESFDSMTLEKVGKDRFKVVIKYLDKEGKKQKHEFEGTRAEIRQAIQNEKNLPDNERGHLLRGLDLQGPQMMMPGGNFVPELEE